jgi:hypothetical protein
MQWPRFKSLTSLLELLWHWSQDNLSFWLDVGLETAFLKGRFQTPESCFCNLMQSFIVCCLTIRAVV